MEVKVPKPKMGGPVVIHDESSLVRKTHSSDGIDISKKSLPDPPKKPLDKKEIFKDGFVEICKDVVWGNVILPGLKNMAIDALNGIADETIGNIASAMGMNYVPSVRSRGRISGHERKYRDYSSISNDGRRQIALELVKKQYNRLNISHCTFASKEEADTLLEGLTDICDDQGALSVYDFYHYAQVPSDQNGYPNYEYGWSSEEFSRSRVMPSRDINGDRVWYIDTPIPRPKRG